eukprot:gene4915-5056_t
MAPAGDSEITAGSSSRGAADSETSAGLVLLWAAKEMVPFEVRLYAFEDLPSNGLLRMSKEPECHHGTDFKLKPSAAVSVESDAASAGTGAGAAALTFAAVGGLLSGSPGAGLHTMRAIRGTICSGLSVTSGFEEGLSVLLEPAGVMFPDAPEIAN